VLFVCLHGAAKSVIAATQFRRLAAGRGLRADATFAGTEPDPQIAPGVVAALAAEGIDVGGLRPRPVTAEDVATATRIVTLGCDLGVVAPGVAVDRWDDVPAVSDGYETARAAIVARVARLVDQLAGGA
jgi:protein-tyrosine-phosphatase